jgi:hypothetical protein
LAAAAAVVIQALGEVVVAVVETAAVGAPVSMTWARWSEQALPMQPDNGGLEVSFQKF